LEPRLFCHLLISDSSPPISLLPSTQNILTGIFDSLLLFDARARLMLVLQRYSESIKYRRPIPITGLTLEGQVSGFTGVVQSVDHDAMRDKGRLCVPKTLSALMTSRNRVSWRNDPRSTVPSSTANGWCESRFYSSQKKSSKTSYGNCPVPDLGEMAGTERVLAGKHLSACLLRGTT